MEKEAKKSRSLKNEVGSQILITMRCKGVIIPFVNSGIKTKRRSK